MFLADWFKKVKRELKNSSKTDDEIDYELFVKDAMVTPVFVKPQDSSEKIIQKLKREDIDSCIVVDDKKHFIGQISDYDLIKIFRKQVKFEALTYIINRGYKTNILHKNAGELVNKNKFHVTPDTPINKAIEILYREKVGYLPVIHKKKVVGVITPSCLIDFLKNY